MPFSFKNYFKEFTSSTGSTLMNLGTFGLANTGESIYEGVKDYNEFNEKQRANRNANAKLELDVAQKEKEDKIAADRDEAERLRQTRQPGRKQTLLNLQSNNSLLTGF